MASTKPFERLPTCVVPVHYDVWLKPNLNTFVFEGKVDIQLKVTNATSKITCNAAELKIKEIKVVGGDGADVPVKNFETNETDELLSVELSTVVPVSEVQFSCVFEGILNDKMVGLYRSKYNQNGEDRHAAVTQFEAADARRAFPCWDEPALKATFSITVVAPKDRVVLSNMPEKSIQDCQTDHTYKVVEFEKSPRMSTYLVAVVVGEFEYVEGRTKGGVLVRVFTPVGKKEQGNFALDTSIRSLEFYTEFFDVKYPLPKYDCVAISDFQCGAMENWGLVTFRETAVLVDPYNTSANSKQWISVCVSHEMAHQWFGNLVTMEWWTHLWLNEGFASFMETHCNSILFPEFDMWTQFVTETLIPAFQLDSLDNSHPIEVPVGPPSEVDEIFDNISYNKGASVIHMLYDYIGDAAFRSGMKSYLTKFSYKNAETPDLWASLEEASGKPVGKVMSTWTSQMGFPLITVVSSNDNGNKTLTLTQEKFNANGSKSSGYQWCVPIIITTASGGRKEVLLETESMTVTLENTSADEWFKLNPGFVGYYQVRYSPGDLLLLQKAIEEQSLSEVDRLNVLNDTFELAKAGKASTVDFLNLLTSYKHDKSYVVWTSIVDAISTLNILIGDSDYHEQFKTFVVDLLREIMVYIGWEPKAGEPHVNGLLRSMIILKIGVFGHTETIEEARRKFFDHYSGVTQIPADLRAAVYRIVMAHGDSETLAQMQKLFRESDFSEEKERLARSLGVSQKKDILEKVLEFSMAGEVRSQDIPFVIASVGNNIKGRQLAWDFLKANFTEFLSKYKSGMLMNSLCRNTTENFVTLDKALEIENFFKANSNPADRVVKQSIETINLNAAWLERDGDKIQKFFSAN